MANFIIKAPATLLSTIGAGSDAGCLDGSMANTAHVAFHRWALASGDAATWCMGGAPLCSENA